MNFLQRIFTKTKVAVSKHFDPVVSRAMEDTEQSIKDDTERLWKLIEEALKYYDSIACPCAFPQFRQYVGIDCSEYHKSFYMSETEGFIHHAGRFFEVQVIDNSTNNEVYNAIYSCKKCGTTYDCSWSDFSIVVNRTFLKVKNLKVIDIGAGPETPIPFYVGLFGHSYPDKDLFQKVDFDIFERYLYATKLPLTSH